MTRYTFLLAMQDTEVYKQDEAIHTMSVSRIAKCEHDARRLVVDVTLMAGCWVRGLSLLRTKKVRRKHDCD